jgi:hypothetical protein
MLLGCYGWIAYATIALSQRLGGSALAQAGFAALLGSEAWALLDAVGAQFIWWHWHTSEPLYEDREGGVPVASSFWITASMGSMALVLMRSPSHAACGVLAGPLATLGLMNVPFTLIYHPLVTFAGYHASVALWVLRAACAAPLISRVSKTFRPDASLFGQMVALVALVVGVALFADPTAETRTSFGQACVASSATFWGGASRCGELETSFWGAFERTAHTCTASNRPARDLYRICDPACDASRTPLETFTSCGVPRADGWTALVLAHSVAVIALAAMPFTPVPHAAAKTA